MEIGDCEELIQIESEELAESLLGTGFFDLSPELKIWIRGNAIESLGSVYEEEESMAVA
jgi:hypothetical protein